MDRRRQKDKVKNYSGSSEHLKKDLSIKKVIDVRLQIFMVLLAAIAGGLIYRLYTIQIVQADHYANLYEKYQTPPLYSQTMRGEMVDRNGVNLVSNQAKKVIVYDRPRNTSAADQWDVAKLFAKTFNIQHSLNEDDNKVLWLRLNDYGEDLVTEEEYKSYTKGNMTKEEYDELIKSRITPDHLNTLTEEDKATFEIQVKMNNGQLGQSSIVYENATNEQISYLAEHSNDFPGFSYDTEWERVYNETVDIKNLYGSLGDIPEQKLDTYIAKGYQADDEVGVSGLEYQYENELSGIDTQYEYQSGTKQLRSEGRKGYGLKLALDTDLQKFVEAELTKRITDVNKDPQRTAMDQMHMIVSDPRTGDILAIAAMKENNSSGEMKYWNDIQSTMLSNGTFAVGSTVKPATVYMGLSEDVIQPNELILDAPMNIGGLIRHSWKDGIGNVDARSALQMSSNIYMFNVAIRLGNATYVPGSSLIFPDGPATYDLMRSYYSQFGLGVPTNVDFPREEIGYIGSREADSKLLELAIGQYDTYNVMELNQFVATIANNGTRMKPRLATGTFNQDTKAMVSENTPQALSTLDDLESLRVVQEGMRLYISSGEGYASGKENYKSAGKSGTAQISSDGIELRNSTYIGYAPYEQPEIAVSCIAPKSVTEAQATRQTIANECGYATHAVMDYYMARKSQ